MKEGAYENFYIGDTRTEKDFVRHVQNTVNTDPSDQWSFVVDQLNTHKSAGRVWACKLRLPYILQTCSTVPWPVQVRLRCGHHSAVRRRRNAFPITETELKLIAALASMGLSSTPNHGYSTPAAIGTPMRL